MPSKIIHNLNMNDTRGLGRNKRSHPYHKCTDRQRQKPRHELGPRYGQRQILDEEPASDEVLVAGQEVS